MSGTQEQRGGSGSAGFTLVEVLIVALIFVPILLAVSSTTGMVSGTVNTNDRSAEVLETLRKSMQRLGQLVRPGSITTIRMQAIQQDVTDGKAASVGDWIEPKDLEFRPGIRFQSADGVLSMNAAALTPPREITFTMETGELDNDLDDDGDGMIDEGTVYLLYGATRVNLVEGVEDCQFAMDGRLLRITMQTARADAKKRVHRATIQETFYLRNN